MWVALDRIGTHGQRLIVTDEILMASHNRCKTYGLSRDICALSKTVDDDELAALTGRLGSVMADIRDFSESLILGLSANQKLFFLTDTHGNVVDMFGDRDVVAAGYEFGVTPGTSLGERWAGTTAVSLVLSYRMPAYLTGTDHYCKMFHDWECLGVPIFGSDGCVLACLGVGSYLGSSLATNHNLRFVKSIAERLDASDRVGENPPPYRFGTARPDDKVSLSARQLQVLRLRANGYLNKQIAVHLDLHVDTVKEHVSAARKRLGVKSIEEAIKILASWQAI